MLGCLGDDVSAGVEAGASGATGESLELAHAQAPHLRPVELRQAREQDGADGDVDAHAEGVGSGDDEEDALEGESFDEAAVLRRHSRVVDPDPVEEEAAQRLTEALGEGEPLDLLGDARLLVLRREVDREQSGGEFDGPVLGVGDDVDGGLVMADEGPRRIGERFRRVFEVERHGAGRRGDHRGIAPGRVRHRPPDLGGVAEGRGHEDELCLRQFEERDLPGPASGGVGEVVELVHDDHADVEDAAFARRLVREDLRGRADDRGVAVDGRVPGDHADVLGSEGVDEGEELLAHERLERGGVVGPDAAGERGVEREEGDEDFPEPVGVATIVLSPVRTASIASSCAG